MTEFIIIIFCGLCVLILLETAFGNSDIPDDVVRGKK